MKKFLLGLAVVVVVAIGGLWGFVLLAGRDAPPPDDGEFVVASPEIAPADNAFTYFLDATNLLVETTNRQLVAEFLAGKTADDGQLREWVERNAACLAQVRRGTECAVCWMPTVLAFDTEFPYLTAWLDVGRMLAIQARQARLAGRTDEAAEAALTEARMGNLVLKHAESTIHYWVGLALATQGLDALLDVAGESAAAAEWAPALEELGPFDEGLARALKAECRYETHLVAQLADGEIHWLDLLGFGNARHDFRAWVLGVFQQPGYFFQPQATRRSLHEFYRRMIRDVALPYARIDLTDEREFGRGWTDWLRPNAFGRALRNLMTPPAGLTLEKKCRIESLRAGAQLVVACNRFEQARGRRPETLAELVPEYLGEVPRDPYDGEPFRYSAEKGLVWAVGRNLTDEGGSARVESDKDTAANRDRHKAEDFVFPLRAKKP
ncbi:MAG: hypothetical protein AB7V22_12055 [Kiritimatiellia bacterium]